MDKSIYTKEYAALLRLLRQAREKAGVTQVDLAERIQETQSYVSKVERGELRLDVVQLRTICEALGLALPVFVERLEREIGKRK
jgi:transcriptional regulator with XRE-family HTH domain